MSFEEESSQEACLAWASSRMTRCLAYMLVFPCVSSTGPSFFGCVFLGSGRLPEVNSKWRGQDACEAFLATACPTSCGDPALTHSFSLIVTHSPSFSLILTHSLKLQKANRKFLAGWPHGAATSEASRRPLLTIYACCNFYLEFSCSSNCTFTAPQEHTLLSFSPSLSLSLSLSPSPSPCACCIACTVKSGSRSENTSKVR